MTRVKIGVILYGPPAAGKDTITAALTHLDGRYSLFRRIKVGAGRVDGYRLTTAEEVKELREAGQVLWENSRYNALYVVDKPYLVASLLRGFPVVHVGQPEAVQAISSGVPDVAWLIVSVWCPRDVAASRIASRDTGDTAARLTAWDETPLLAAPNLSLDTSTTSAIEAAQAIDDQARRLCAGAA